MTVSPLFPYIAALISGLVGGVHCIGMCGGIVGTITLGLPKGENRQFITQLPYHLAYNWGRIASYVVAGAIMGAMGMLLAEWLPIYLAQRALLCMAGLFMVLLGLYLAGWWRILASMERAGTRLWSAIEPFARRLLPIRNPAQAFVVGLVWGWIPCGLVYAMLANAISTGSPLGGAGVMLAFGIGTLPNLIGMGLLAGAAAHLGRSARMRNMAGATMIGLGAWTIWGAF